MIKAPLAPAVLEIACKDPFVPDYPDTLAKFCTLETADKILDSRSLRWSSPHLFRDPFEPDHRTTLTFNPQVILEGVLRSVTGMIFSPDDPRGSAPLMTVIRRWREEERFATPEEAQEVLRELMGRMVDQRLEDLDEVMADWRRFTRQLRICCFSAKTDNLICWRQYADQHRGLVLRFNTQKLCGDAVPRAVEYRQTRPEITTLREQLNAVLYSEHPNPRETFMEKFLHKSPTTGNEQEWRVFHEETGESSRAAEDDLWFDDRPFEPEALVSVYLGAYMPAADRKHVYDLVKQHYPHCKLFQAGIVAGKYEIEFQRLTQAL